MTETTHVAILLQYRIATDRWSNGHSATAYSAPYMGRRQRGVQKKGKEVLGRKVEEYEE